MKESYDLPTGRQHGDFGGTQDTQDPQEPRNPKKNKSSRQKIGRKKCCRFLNFRNEEEGTLRVPVFSDLALSLYEAIDKGVDQNDIDKGNSDFRSPIFNVVRFLRADPVFRRTTLDEVVDRVGEITEHWKRNSKQDVWEFVFDVSWDEASAEIVDFWDKIRCLPGKSLLESVAIIAEDFKLIPKVDVWKKRQRNQSYARFLSFCGVLQTNSSASTPIALPCREVADALVLSPMGVSRYRKCAVQDGYLRHVGKYQFNGVAASDNRADEYLFAYEEWDSLKDRAKKMGSEQHQQQQRNDAPPVPPNSHALFVDYWTALPPMSQSGRPTAEKAFKQAIKKESPETIIAMAHKYAESVVGRGRFARSAAKLLNEEFWADNPLSWERVDLAAEAEMRRVEKAEFSAKREAKELEQSRREQDENDAFLAAYEVLAPDGQAARLKQVSDLAKMDESKVKEVLDRLKAARIVEPCDVPVPVEVHPGEKALGVRRASHG